MRQRRKLQINARYHVVARANRKEMILLDDSVKDLFLGVLKEAKDKYSFSIATFCILGNHFHLFIQPGKGENLSRIMQWVLSVFAMRYNKKMGYTGHVWGERFFSQIIDGIFQFIRTFLYINDNPVKANLVAQPNQWKYGGVYHFHHGRHDILDIDDLTSALFLSYNT
jgi:putative transposase